MNWNILNFHANRKYKDLPNFYYLKEKIFIFIKRVINFSKVLYFIQEIH